MKSRECMPDGLVTYNLAVGYGKRVVVNDVNIEIIPGQILTLIGPNGCGKSTILKSITRQLKTMGGNVYLAGKLMSDMKEEDVAKELAMVMTERIKPELMSCRDVVSTGRFPYTGRLGILSKEDWDRVDDAIRSVNATDISTEPFDKISDGQRQRIMLARAMCQDTGVLVLDEPTSFLDVRYKLDILTKIRELVRNKNIAVIMSLHELDLANQVSDMIACVDGDKISKVGEPEEVFSEGYVQKLYGINESCFDEMFGNAYLTTEKMAPEVFVIGGGGKGIPIYHALQRKGISVAVGVLHTNDVEYSVAKAIASKVVSAKAFYPITEENITEAKKLIASCRCTICAVDEFGPYNEANKALLEYARELGKEEKWQK